MKALQGQFTTIDEYIAGCPEEVRPIVQQLRQVINDVVPDAVETIRYRMPTFKLNGSAFIYFAAWKHHVSLYPYMSTMDALSPETAAYKTSGKGTIQFPLNQPLPLPLIRQMVAFRVQEHLENSEKNV